MSASFSFWDWLQYALSFALVIGLLLGLLYALRKLQGGQAFGRKDQRLQVLESLSLGPRQKIALVRVDGARVLLGITATQITALSPMGLDTSAQDLLTAHSRGEA